jgi:hypothetical protein
MMSRRYAIITGFLAVAFLLRVFGQALVACFQVSFLPPMEDWYSGVLPYPLLLPTQLVILTAQAWITRDLWRGAGFFAFRRPRVGRGLCWISYVYFAVMLLRYVLTMWWFPERRWLHGTIPIFFHWVLAGYLFALGKYYQSSDE